MTHIVPLTMKNMLAIYGKRRKGKCVALTVKSA